MLNSRKIWICIAVFIVMLDQITKYLSTQYLRFDDWITVFPGFALTLRHNTGAAFNFLANADGWQRWFFVGLAMVVSSIIYTWMGRLTPQNKSEGFALSLILGGALGNLVDRVADGYVTDFVLLYYKSWQWPAFNIADSAIFLGVVFLLCPASCGRLCANIINRHR
jgi:signal peptidase II